MKNNKLPDVSSWLPDKKEQNNFKEIFLNTCKGLESLIRQRVNFEKKFNVYNFDSGLSIEEIIRFELSNILPKRYFVTKGIINDRNGLTAGDCDLIIFNEFWFPKLKSGISNESRRNFFPIEGVYATVEIKQTLDFESLDFAMEKLVKNSRLHRPKVFSDRFVENKELQFNNLGSIGNRLYTSIIATNLCSKLTVKDIYSRFFEINKLLPRKEMVRSLCILNKGTFTWSHKKSDNSLEPALFDDEDEKRDLCLCLSGTDPNIGALYCFLADLIVNLNLMTLGPEDIVSNYGPDQLFSELIDAKRFKICS